MAMPPINLDIASNPISGAQASLGDNGAVKFGNYLFSDSVSGSGVTAKNVALLVGVGLLSLYVIKKVKK